ncbi:hypothetical protein DB346_16905 [Verrucomicrobia bacterium LW23]|nr:hypothetical protein DB346_16905 [Verrucomicrobia bacterium LW23]
MKQEKYNNDEDDLIHRTRRAAATVTRRLSERNGSKAFSLVEILVVLSLIGVVMGVMVPALGGFGLGRGAQLNYSGNQVANLINLARQNSMSKNVMTALVVITDPSVLQGGQGIILMELKPRTDGATATPADWKPVTKWETLGAGSIVDRFVSFETEQPQPAFPAFRYGTASIAASYNYIVFLPGGNLLGSAGTSQIRLTEGFFPKGDSAPVLTRRGANGQPVNTYNITILGATGRTKIDRL